MPIINNLGGNETEITSLYDFLPGSEYNITEVYFGELLIFTGGGWAEMEGPLPLTFSSISASLLNYRIYGASGGVGEQTENLLNTNVIQGAISTSNGAIVASSQRVATEGFILLTAGTYTISSTASDLSSIGFMYASNVSSSYTYVITGSATWRPLPFTFTLSESVYVRFSIAFTDGRTITPDDVGKLVLVKGSTAPSTYIPYGYKIPVTCGGQTTPIYIGDTTLQQGEYVDYESQKIYKASASNLLPPLSDPSWETGYINAQGTVVSDGKYKTSDFVEVVGGEKYAFVCSKSQVWQGVLALDANKNAISMLEESISSAGMYIITMPSNAKYVRVYVPVDSITEYHDPEFTSTINFLPSINDPSWTGGYIDANGNIVDSGSYASNYATSDFVEVTAGETYEFICSTSQLWHGVLAYDTNKTPISMLIESTSTQYSYLVTMPSGTKYVRVYIPMNNAQISEYHDPELIGAGGSGPLVPTDPPVALSAISTTAGQNTLSTSLGPVYYQTSNGDIYTASDGSYALANSTLAPEKAYIKYRKGGN